jgi:peptide/nickel transport system substrate-binding protein
MIISTLGMSACSEGVSAEFTVNEVQESKVEQQQEVKKRNKESMVIAMRSPVTLHPIYNVEKSVEQTLHLLFNTLVHIETDGSVSPLLAESFTPNPEENSLLIYLRRDVLWHNGEKLTAEDVAFTIETIQRAQESVYKKNVENIANVQVVDAYTLKITYRQAYSAMLQTLFFPVIPKSVYDVPYDQAVKLDPVGSGPYQFASKIPLKEMHLIANKDYFKGNPSILNIEIIMTPDDESTLSAFEQNLIDVIYTDALDWGKYAKDKSSTIYEVPTNLYEFMGVNFNRPVFQNTSLRNAMMYGLDRIQIVEVYYLGHGVVTDTPIHPSSYLASGEVSPRGYDPEKSKVIIAGEGYELDSDTGFFSKNEVPLSFELLVNKENVERVKVAEGIKQMYEQIGIEVNLAKVDKNTYLTRIYSKQYDAFMGGWKFSYMMDLSFAFHSTQILGGDNFISYQSSEMDELLQNAFRSSPNQITEAYSLLENYFSKNNPYISLYFRNGALITKNQIGGEIIPSPLNIYASVEKWKIQ